MIITQAGVFSGDTGIYYKKEAELKGYDAIYVDHVFLPINSIFPGFSMFKQPSSKKIHKMTNKAKSKISNICNDITRGERKYNGKKLFQRIGGWGQRSNYDKIVDSYKTKMYIKETECIGCGICYRICPANAIQKNNKGIFVINTDKCIFCLKCYNYCPRTCALKEEESANTIKYPRYTGLNSKVKPITYRKGNSIRSFIRGI